MKLFLVFLFVSFLFGLVFRESSANQSTKLAAGVALCTMALYFLFTHSFI